MIDPKYRTQVELLLQTIPYIAKEKIFALKGGTAINLFIRSLPRLSVDIDLTYIPINDRETALSDISDGLGRIKADLEKSIPGISVTAVSREGEDAKINCQLQKAQIKIEVNTTTRGAINELLNPTFIDQRNAFETQFSGMSDIPFSYEEFEETRKELVSEIISKLTIEDRMFLVSFKEADPIWEFFNVENASELPAVRWKLQNIERLKRENPQKHTDLVNTLDKLLLD